MRRVIFNDGKLYGGISIHAPRVGCDTTSNATLYAALISIHAPRVGCDRCARPLLPVTGNFNPRTPCGVRHAATYGWKLSGIFQSTHPVWGATPGVLIWWRRRESFQSTHPVWGATALRELLKQRHQISIHAPRVGCDACGNRFHCSTWPFQSTHPVWGATVAACTVCCFFIDFNPRTPCGVRRVGGFQRDSE